MNIFKKAWTSLFHKEEEELQSIIPFIGATFNVGVTMQEVMSSDGSLQIFLDKLALVFGFDMAEIYFNENGVYFKVYDPESGEVHIVDEDDGCRHMVDFLGDIQSRRMNITPFEIRMRYIGIASEDYSTCEGYEED